MHPLTPILYAIAWFLFLFLVRLSPSKYLDNKVKRNNFITAVHALVLSVVAFIYLVLHPEFFEYTIVQDLVIRHLTAISVGFYIFSIINLYIAEKKPPTNLIVHHISSGTLLWYIAITEYMPGFLGYLLCFQFTGFVYSTYLILKDTPGESAKRILFWYDLNYYTWIVVRMIGHTVFVFFAIYFEFIYFKLSLFDRIFIDLIGGGFLVLFNTYVMYVLLKVRDRRKTQIREKYSVALGQLSLK